MMFTGPLVVAVREGRKTQTRRLCKHRNGIESLGGIGDENDPDYWGYAFDGPSHYGYAVLGRGHNERFDHGKTSIPCPYGQPGDRLWVRERMRVIDYRHRGQALDIRVRYEADSVESGWIRYPERLRWQPTVGKCLPYGGFREASRITLEVTGDRVERLQDITEEDAKAEGVALGAAPCKYLGSRCNSSRCPSHNYRPAFRSLWDAINAKRATWDSNPWVWVVEFKLHEVRS